MLRFMSDYLDPNNEELLKDFFGEAQAQVETLEQNILVLENDPSNKDAVDEIFRAAHTLKGGAATVQMFEISELTHVVEDLLDEIRSGGLKTTPEMVDTLLSCIDVVKEMLDVRLAGGKYDGDVEPLKNSLLNFLKPQKAAPAAKSAPKAGAAPPTNPVKKSSAGISEYDWLELKEAANGAKVLKVSVHFDESNPMNSVGGIQVFAALKELGTVLKTNPDFDRLYEDNFYPTVDYFMVLKEDRSLLEKKLRIPDVTTDFDILEVNDGAVGATQKAEVKTPPPAVPKKEQPSASVPQSPAVEKDPASLPKEGLELKEGPVEETEEKSLKEGEGKKASTGSILRVDSKRIDNLLNLVSETVINKASFNQISNHFTENLVELQSTSVLYKDQMKDLLDRLPEYLEELKNGLSVKDLKKRISGDFGKLFTAFDGVESRLKQTVGTFKGTSQNLGRIISELHEGVLRIRMVPIAQIFSRFPRLVRDLSKTLNKRINLVIEGEDTELDKSVIEDLLDPLIHCVRNSIDHGIESPEDRAERGKVAEGTVTLAARNEGNMIIIEVGDDGKGIDVEAVKQKAIERGLIHPSKNLTDTEAFNLIFEPGFSTAAAVTNISGRGVGLDVVRKQIEKLNGTVAIVSERGIGTKFVIKLPLTLAIIQGLLVKVGTEIYAIPITSVIDSHRIKPSEIKVIDNYEVFNVRKDVISLLRLNRLFGIQAAESSQYNFVVVVGSGDKKMGLMVDSLIGEEDVVIKPLKDRYTLSPGIAGATILGDGKVSLIIDVSQLLELGLKNERAERQKRDALRK